MTHGPAWACTLAILFADAYVAASIDASGKATVLEDPMSDDFAGFVQRGGDADSRQAIITSGRSKARVGPIALVRGTHSLLQVGTDGKLWPLETGGRPVARWLPSAVATDAAAGSIIEVAVLDGAPRSLTGTGVMITGGNIASMVLGTAALDGAVVTVTAKGTPDATATSFAAEVVAGTLTITANANATADVTLYVRIGG